eukprot:gene32181-16720_t
MKYYNNVLFHNVQPKFIAQTGDPTGTGKGGSSLYGTLYGEQARCFEDEIRPHLLHKKAGAVGMASAGPNMNASQFYITLADEVDSLDEKHTLFGQVSEGLDVLEKLNEVFSDSDGRPRQNICIRHTIVSEGLDVLEKLNEVFSDSDGRPLQNIRIRHTIVLDDPFDDPPELEDLIPEVSPEPQFEKGDRLEDDWAPEEDQRPAEEIEKETNKAEAFNRAVVLEMIGDLPEADVKPPSNMLFICKLNPATSEEDLEIIFGRFGTITSCDIIREVKTGDSLCFGFIGFDSDASCEEGYFKMNNVLIDDRRIKVDFSQSVHHLWKQFKKGGSKGGDASMAAAASAHERDAEVARDRLGGAGGRLEMKGGGGYGGGRGGGGRGRGPAMDGENELAEARGGHAQGHGARGHQPPRDQGGRDGGGGSGGGRSYSPHRKSKDKERDRSRSRSRDRARQGVRGVDRGQGGGEGGKDLGEREERGHRDREEKGHRDRDEREDRRYRDRDSKDEKRHRDRDGTNDTRGTGTERDSKKHKDRDDSRHRDREETEDRRHRDHLAEVMTTRASSPGMMATAVGSRRTGMAGIGTDWFV